MPVVPLAIDIAALEPLDDLIRKSGDAMRDAAARIGMVPDFDKAQTIVDDRGRPCYSIPLRSNVARETNAGRQTK